MLTRAQKGDRHLFAFLRLLHERHYENAKRCLSPFCALLLAQDAPEDAARAAAPALLAGHARGRLDFARLDDDVALPLELELERLAGGRGAEDALQALEVDVHVDGRLERRRPGDGGVGVGIGA